MAGNRMCLCIENISRRMSLQNAEYNQIPVD